MDKLFFQILNMSITSCYVILFVIIVRLFLRKAPKVFSYALWFVVLLRLISPFSFESVFSLIPINTQTISQDVIYSQTPQIHSGIVTIDQAANNLLPTPMVISSVNPMQIWIALGEVLWLFGMVVLLIYSVFTAIRLHLKLRSAKSVFNNVYEMNGIETPFVFGAIKPKIYLPIGLSENEKTYIIKHEQTHIKGLDHIIKPFAFLILCVHWFNPLVWVAFFLMSEDMELSCDESVIKQMGSEIKKDYSASLLSLSTGRRIIGGCPLAFGENNTKGRIINILNYKKPAFGVVIVAIIAVITIGMGLMANPKEATTSNDTEKIQMAETWAEALKTRDGKPRYEIMSESMKEKFVAEQIQRSGEKWNYIIRYSSPWVVNYEIDVENETASIIYHMADSGGGKYELTEIITFGKENNRLVIIDANEKIAQWDRVSYFAPDAERAMEVYIEALLESDYLKLLSLTHTEPFDSNGQEIWDSIKINDVKVISEDVRENKGYYELELDIEDGGSSAFEKGIFPHWLWIVKGERGWYVEGLMTSGSPDANWWNY